MSETTASTETGGRTGFVFVKLIGKNITKKSRAKRIVLAQSLHSFRNTCHAVFHLDDNDIKAFYDPENNFIHHISEIEPGTTIFASTDPPEGEDANFSFDQRSSKKNAKLFDPSAPLLYAEFPKAKKVPFGMTPKCMVVGFPQPLTIDQANLRYKERKHEDLVNEYSARSSRLSARSSLRSPSPTGLRSSPQASKNFHFFDQTSYTYANTDASLSTTSMRPQKIEVQQEVLTKTRLDKAKILLSQLFSQSELRKLTDLSQAFANLSEKQKKFISQADANEKMQKGYWVKAFKEYLAQNHFCEKTDGLCLNEEIRTYVKDSIKQHRQISGSSAHHRFNTAIVGPPQSGKSTILEIYAQEIVLDLAICGDWKNYYILAYDFQKIIPMLKDPQQFYLSYLRMICDTITIQKPILLSAIADIRSYFESIVTSPAPLVFKRNLPANLPQREISEQLTEIGYDIATAWNIPVELDYWMSLVFELPIRIAKALMFESTLLIIDNADLSDIHLKPLKSFENPKKGAFVSESLKYALNQCEYILSCKDMKKLYSIFIPMNEESIDLLAITDFVTTNGIASTVEDSDISIIANISTQELPITMRSSDCDGVPNYIMHWSNFIQSITEIAEYQEGTPEFENAYYYSLSLAQNVFNLLYTLEGADYSDEDSPNYPHVQSIRKATDEENDMYLAEQNQYQSYMNHEIDAIPIANAPENKNVDDNMNNENEDPNLAQTAPPQNLPEVTINITTPNRECTTP